MSKGIESDFMRETEVRETQVKSFMVQHIIGANQTNKVISKQLIEMILPIERQPIRILKQQNQLTRYIRINAEDYINQFFVMYHSKDQFKLTKYGQYCAQDTDRYIIFSEFMVGFLCIRNKKWTGFCYHQGNNAYIGQFSNMLSNGSGKGLFQFEHSHPSKNTKKTIYHEFQGLWQNGQIKTGTRKSYQSYGNAPFMQYKGNFNNFSFHGEKGILRTREKTLEGRFHKGVLVTNDNAVLTPAIAQALTTLVNPVSL